MNKMIFIFCLTLLVLCLFSFKGEEEVLRVRVIANSDTADDQGAKMRVVERLNALFEKENFGSVEEAKCYIDSMLETIEDISRAVSGQRASARLGSERFEDGEYTSLVVTLGEGMGHNFWGTLFPDVARGASSGGGKSEPIKVIWKNGELIEIRMWLFEQFLKIL